MSKSTKTTNSFSQLIKEKLWNDGDLGTVDIYVLAEELYGKANAYTLMKARQVIQGVKKELEDFTGHILHVDDGMYTLVPFSEMGIIDIENDKRQSRVVSHLNTLKRSYKTILLHKSKSTQYLKEKYQQLMSQVDKAEPNTLLSEAKHEEELRGLAPTKELLKLNDE